MSQVLCIRGGRPLRGSIVAQGSKNATLPIMAAALLLKGGKLRLKRVPNLLDIATMADLLKYLGARVDFDNHEMSIEVPEEISWETPPSLVRKMRASSLVLGPLLSRCGKAVLPLPGGCAIGSRPIDLHLKGLSKMGASIEVAHGAVTAEASELRGTRIYLDFPSVGATENVLMAAVFAKGETLIENAAREPEIANLAQALREMGANISGEGTGIIRIRGVDALHDAEVEIIPDRIEASTYLLAGVITGGEVTVRGVILEHLDALLAKLEEAGATVVRNEAEVKACAKNRLHSINVKTLPYPGFPTDLQPQMMAVLSLASGTSVIREEIFEARFLHVGDLKRMGAAIEVQGNMAIVKGCPELMGCDVKATDLRAGAALILAGLAAKGETRVHALQHIWRGYEQIEEKIASLGASLNLAEMAEEEVKW
ncbi:MAG: UDP-N-acetylglucosamine 1-carboxyvinyltransferase [Synergistales bacterium]|nr:UDP-N-acetylglucosamine 1-carboxyvinyltransferase [Synergistales bacterium]